MPACRSRSSAPPGPTEFRCKCTRWTPIRSFVDEGDIDAARELVDEAKDAELFLYPGDQHLFADSSLPSYDPDAAALLRERVLSFLATC
jgi:dienelactone hydrolase